MFKDDIDLVQQVIEQYGYTSPLADLGGLAKPTIADYSITIATGNQKARYITLPHRPFDTIDSAYQIFNPENGDPPIENMVPLYANTFGTIVCLSVLEHVRNPFEIFNAFYELLKPGGLLIVSTVFSFPLHPSPDDNWRFSPECLNMLAKSAQLEVLEYDWRLRIHAGMGVKEIRTGEPQEIKSCYVVARKPG